MNWTPERVERLKKLWAEGYSASQIAVQLGDISRNAVIGKVQRLKLPGRRRSSTGWRTKQIKSPKSPHIPAWQRRPASEKRQVVKTAPPIAPATQSPIVPVSQRLPLEKLNESTCKWPNGDPVNDKDTFGFCGHKKDHAGPYCTYHARIAYQPRNGQRRQEEAA